MKITCPNCSKKFQLQDNLIPKAGRLLQCGSCDHKWFYKKSEIINQILSDESKPLDLDTKKEDKPKKIFKTKKKINIDEIRFENQIIDEKPKKKINYFNFFIVIIISLIAVIIILDTFKYSISTIFPNIEILLDSLYETLKDINLFLKDLFN